MIKKIDLFMPPRSQYGVLHHFTLKLAEALKRQGIDTEVLEAVWNDPRPFLEKIFNRKPDCTLSFNGLLPDDEGRFFCDLIGIPHVAYLVDSQNQFFPLVQSPNTIVVGTDQFSCEFFRGIKCKNVIFVPHGVERELSPDLEGERIYDVTILSSLVDFEDIRTRWKERFPKVIRDAIDEAIEETLTEDNVWYVQALVNSLDRQMELKGAVDPAKIDFISILDDMEMYIKGKSRVDLIKSIKDAKVHLFGAPDSSKSWSDYIGNKPNVVIHEPVPYAQALEIFKQSKIVLNSSPWIRNGSHERVLSSMACKALVITDRNEFLSNHFKDGEELILYPLKDLENVNDLVNEYLSDNKKRELIASKGREAVMSAHTWDHRAKTLLKELDPILESLKELKK